MSQGSLAGADGAGLTAGPVRVTSVAPGVLVATEVLPWARAVALSATVVAGSIDEPAPIAGAAHLIEHLLFRGSSRYGAGEVDHLFDDLGADLTASTDRCQTQLATWVMAEHVRAAVDAMSDVMWRPSLTDDDVAHEREIVLEELAMIEDSPEELTFELLGDALYPDSPLGRPVIGRRETIDALDAEALGAFHRDRYSVAPVVWVGVGAVDHDALCEQISADLPDWRSPQASAPVDQRRGAVGGPPTRIIAARQTEQLHVALAVPLDGARGPRRAALQVLDALIGGPPSSRLFQEIRERRGLAYSVGSFLELQQGFGAFGAYLGTRPERAETAVGVLAGELRRVAGGELAERELAWARRHVAGRMGLSLETAGGRAAQIAGRLAAGQPIVDPSTLAAEVAAIDVATLTQLAREVLGQLDRSAVACVAPDIGVAADALDAAGLATGASAVAAR
ncbi:MAG: pitrilysin family protein [Patulibacter sp.]